MTVPAAPRALCLAGPTAAGKSAAALAIAQAMPVEIVSVDSALVYRGMDIGTAKPSPAERAAVPHHLVDILEPHAAYSAAAFAADAARLVDEIRARGRLPLLVGGTMLYFKALIEGLDTMPAADPALRARLDAEAARDGWPALHARLARNDPATAARLAPNDAQRIQRALEVLQLSGQPLSRWQGRLHGAARWLGGLPQDAEEATAPGPAATLSSATPSPDHGDLSAAWPLISLEPEDRGWLHDRIATRLDAMRAEGFLDEVRRLRARGDLAASMPSMRCVGYRQAWEALDDGSPEALDRWPGRAMAATRQLAKRQLTWLRGLPQRRRVACDAPDAIARVVAAARRAWGR